MANVRFNLIAAACENMGIGVNGTLPWRLKNEMAYFTTMTTKTSNPSKINAVIMGRRTWECIPDKYRPLVNRINIVLSSKDETLKEKVPDGVKVARSLDEVVQMIEKRDDIESAWIIGGSHLYEAAMAHPNCHRVYLTEIQKQYDCDTFFPTIEKTMFRQVTEEGIPSEKQQEKGVDYYFRIYEKIPIVFN